MNQPFPIPVIMWKDQESFCLKPELWVESAGGWLAPGMLREGMLAAGQAIFHLVPGKLAR